LSLEGASAADLGSERKSRMTSVENTSSSQPKKSQLEEFDVVILGGRTGSTVAAWTFAAEGKRVARTLISQRSRVAICLILFGVIPTCLCSQETADGKQHASLLLHVLLTPDTSDSRKYPLSQAT
jgi:hypothetical protein